MMKRRDFVKLGLLSTLAATGGAGFLKIYKHATGVRKIIRYPAPILRTVATPVDVIDDQIISLCHQMLATLRYSALIGFFSQALLSKGLAAPQLGVAKRLIACGLYGELKVLINPEVIEERGTYSGYENCLSLPDYGRKIVERPDFIKVKFRELGDRENQLSASKGYAALLAHEIDHLNGVLYIDY